MSNVNEQALEEIYFPAFKSAVQQGGAWAVMTAANGVNGDLACQSHFLLTTTLKEQWGFGGLVLTDFNHARNTEKAALAGLDISMPSGSWQTESFGKPLMDAVIAGKFPVGLIDDKVRRILRVRQRVGLLGWRRSAPRRIEGHTGASDCSPKSCPREYRVAQECAACSPVGSENLETCGRSWPKCRPSPVLQWAWWKLWRSCTCEVTVQSGLRKRLGSHTDGQYLAIEKGGAIDQRYLKTKQGTSGVAARYFNDGTVDPALQRTEKSIDFNWDMRSPETSLDHTDNFRAEYEGTVTPPVSGYYTLRLSGQNSSTLFLRNRPALANHANGGFYSATAGVHLDAGVPDPFRVKYHAGVGDASLHLEWSLPRSSEHIDAAVRTAEPSLRSADAVIFVGGWNHGLDTEGLDRQDMDFPKGQAELIREIAPFSPHTVVILWHDSPVPLEEWIDSVPSVLDAFYPGMEGGTAVPKALVGDINPAGKLTFSWPKQLKDSPTYAIGTADKGNVNFKEGVFVRYRYFDAKNIAPHFPFGFGMSYSDFKFSNLKVASSGGLIHVTVDVQNLSERAGADVVQLYVHPPPLDPASPIHELRGFERVLLQPHEKRSITMHLDGTSLHWDSQLHD